MTQGDDDSKQYPRILEKDGFSVIGYTNNSPIIQTPESIFNAPDTTFSNVLEPVIMGKDTGGDWTVREVELRRKYIEENITFRHRQKWDMLPEWHKVFYVKSAYSPLLIPMALDQIERKDKAALQQWYSGITTRNDARLRMSLKELGDMIFPLPIQQGIRKGFMFALAVLIRDYNLSAYGTAVESCKMLSDNELERQIEKLSPNISVYIYDVFSMCESGYCFHGVNECLNIWTQYIEIRKPSRKSETKDKEKRQSTKEKEDERLTIYQQVVEEFGRTSREGKLDGDIIKEAAKRANCSIRTMHSALSNKK